MEKRWLETLMTEEAVIDFGLDINKLTRVRRKDGTYYVYKEEVSKEMYHQANREYWAQQKRNQRKFDYLKEQGMQLISIDKSKDDTNFDIESESDLEEEAITRLMIEVLEEEIKKLPNFDRQLMDLVFHEDLTQRELAKILGVSVWKINNDIKKNKEILKNILTR